MALKYNAEGRLLASTPLLAQHVDLVLVDLRPEGQDQAPEGKNYVVARYSENSTVLFQGLGFKTFVTYHEAYSYYIGALFLTLPVATMDTHPELAACVAKADRFFKLIGAKEARFESEAAAVALAAKNSMHLVRMGDL